MNLFRMPIHVAIVDGDEAILSEVQRLIGRTDRLRCVSASTSGMEALERLPRLRPHVVIVGLGLSDMQGIECSALLKQELQDAQILIHASHGKEESVSRAFKAGAGGYILQRLNHREIVPAVLELASGGAPMSPEVARTLVQSLWKTNPRHERNERPLLTPREEDILGYLTRGLVNKEIGDRLSISYDTVRHHLKSIYIKLSVRTRTEAVVKYLSSAAFSEARPHSLRPDIPKATGS